MSSITTEVAVQYRLREWAAQIRDCQNRPAGMSVIDWCSRNGITKANYYYRLRRVRSACLENFPEEAISQPVIPVSMELLHQDGQSNDQAAGQGLSISLKGFSVHVTESTSMELLSTVLEVIRNAQ